MSTTPDEKLKQVAALRDELAARCAVSRWVEIDTHSIICRLTDILNPREGQE